MKHLLLTLGLLTASTYAIAEETPAEKTESHMDSAKHSMKKAGHRIQEAVCAEGDLKCAAKKAKHHAEEGADAVGDKVKETKHKID